MGWPLKHARFMFFSVFTVMGSVHVLSSQVSSARNFNQGLKINIWYSTNVYIYIYI